MRQVARTKLGSYINSSTRRGRTTDKRGATRIRRGCTHDVLERLPGRRCTVEMTRDGDGKGEVVSRVQLGTRAAETGLVLNPEWLEPHLAMENACRRARARPPRDMPRQATDDWTSPIT